MSGTQGRTRNTGEIFGSLSRETWGTMPEIKRGGGVKVFYTNSIFVERNEKSWGQDAIRLIHFFEGGC
jgi:hypothetical protein